MTRSMLYLEKREPDVVKNKQRYLPTVLVVVADTNSSSDPNEPPFRPDINSSAHSMQTEMLSENVPFFLPFSYLTSLQRRSSMAANKSFQDKMYNRFMGRTQADSDEDPETQNAKLGHK